MKHKNDDMPFALFRIGDGAENIPTADFVALVDGSAAPMLALDLPLGLRGVARQQVASRQICDSIGTDPGQTELRPFAAKPHTTAWTRVIVTATVQAVRWRDQIAGAGARCLAILPDYLALPAAVGIWVIQADAKQVRVRLGLRDGFASEPDLAVLMLSKAAPGKAILRLGEPCDALDKFLHNSEIPMYHCVADLAAAGMPTPKRFANGELGFDLRLNPKAAFEAMAKTLRSWRGPVILSALALVVWTLSASLALRDVQIRTLAVRMDTIAQVRRSFVTTGPVLDIRRQVSQALSERRNRAAALARTVAPLQMFKQAGHVVAASSADLSAVSYTPQSGLVLNVTMPDFAALDRLVRNLESSQFTVLVSQTRSIDSGGAEAVLSLVLAEVSR